MAMDFTQAMLFCNSNNGRSRTISSIGSQGRDDDPAMLRKKDPSGRITRRTAAATCVIQARYSASAMRSSWRE